MLNIRIGAVESEEKGIVFVFFCFICLFADEIICCMYVCAYACAYVYV